MSDEPIDNYDKEFKLLKRLVEQPSFKFIIVRYNHYDLVNRLKQDLTSLFPDRPVKSLETSETNYREFMDTWESLESGFLLMEHFEDVLLSERAIDTKVEEDTEEDKRRYGLGAGINLRRDKITERSNVLILLLNTVVDSKAMQKLMSIIPDMWSLRSLILELSQAYQPPFQEQVFFIPDFIDPDYISEEEQDKFHTEIDRLQKKLNSLNEDDLDLKLAIYSPLTNALINTGQGEEALKTIQEWKKITKQIFPDYLEGDAYQLVEEYTLAERSYNQALITSSNKELILERLISIAIESEKPEKAEKYLNQFEDILKYQKSDVVEILKKYRMLGKSYFDLKQFSKAKIALEKLLELNDQNNGILEDYEFIYHDLGLIAYEVGNYKEAIEQFQEGIKLLSEESEDNLWLSMFYTTLGLVHRKLGDLTEALKMYNIAKEIQTANVGEEYNSHILSTIGDTYLEFGEYNSAIEKYHRALDLEIAILGEDQLPIEIAYSKLGKAYELSGKYSKALLYFQKALEINVKHFGEAYEKSGKVNDDIKRVRSLMETKSSNSTNHPR